MLYILSISQAGTKTTDGGACLELVKFISTLETAILRSAILDRCQDVNPKSEIIPQSCVL